jgi:tetratricopeptide (TPR) repeat protein
LSQALQLRPDLLEARIDLARSQLEANSPRQTLEILDEAPPSQRSGLAFVVLRNHALLALGEYAECAKGVAAGLARGRVPDLLVQDAELKLIRKNYSAARAATVEALKQDPEHLGALGLLYRTETARKNVSVALEALRQHAAGHPKSARIRAYLGERLLANGERQEARRAFLAAKSAGAPSAEMDLALARLDLLEGNLEAARRTLSRLQAGGSAAPVVHFLAATVESQAGNHRAAIDNYRGVLAADPNHVAALTNLAYLLAEYAQQPEQALPYAQKAKELEPANPDAGGVLGWLCYRKGLYATALQHLSDAVRQDGTKRGGGPAFRKCYLGLTYLKLGDRTRGLGTLQAALQTDLLPREAEVARAAIAGAARTSVP